MNVTAYRKKSSGEGQIGAGTFYFLNIPDAYTKDELNSFKFSYSRNNELLKIDSKHIEGYEGLPSEVLARRWFPEMTTQDWKRQANNFGFHEAGAAMDILVAEKAKNDGWKAIKYGKSELQVL